MQMRISCRARGFTISLALSVAVLLGSIISGCGAPSGVGSASGSVKGIGLNLRFPDGYTFSPQTARLYGPSGPTMATAPGFVVSCTITVTGEGMEPLVVDVPLDTGEVDISVSPGIYTFTVVVRTDNNLYFSGSVTRQLHSGSNGALDIELELMLPEDQSLQGCLDALFPDGVYVDEVKALDCSNRGISDLSGIERFWNLRVLKLAHNKIVDISPLAGLTNLWNLDLYDNQVADISPLAGLTNLTYLQIVTNRVSDISPLSNLTELKTLWAGNNRIADLSPLSALTSLTRVGFGTNQIVDVSPLSGLTGLTELNLGNNRIVNVSPLAPLTNLTWLRLNNNRIGGQGVGKVNSLAALTSANPLYLYNNPGMSCEEADTLVNALGTAVDIDNDGTGNLDAPTSGVNCSSANMYVPIDGLFADPNLQSCVDAAFPSATYAFDVSGALDCRTMGITDISGIQNLMGLTVLYLANNQISDISLLSSLTNLTNLDLYNNQIADISPLSGLTGLTWLQITTNQVTDISALSSLTRLKTLWAGNNQIADISPLSGLNRLTKLGLSSNQIVSVSPLSGLTGLVQLNLGSNQIVDVSPLAGLTNLTWLRLSSNQIGGNNVGKVDDLVGLTNANPLYLFNNPGMSCAEADTLINTLGTAVDINNDGAGNLDAPTSGVNCSSSNMYIPIAGMFADANLQACVEAAFPNATYAFEVSGALDCRTLGITNISGIQNLMGLTVLQLAQNQIVDISPLSSLTNLTNLDLFNNQIADISPLSSLTGLTWLQITTNQVTDITPLSSIAGLQTLWAGGNQIANVSPLSGLTNLTQLGLSSNQIANVSPLSGLTGLVELNLGNNQIVDLSPLASLTSLTWLKLVWNPIGGQGVGKVDSLVTLTSANPFFLSNSSSMSCAEVTTLIGALGTAVDISGDGAGNLDTPTNGTNCTNP